MPSLTKVQTGFLEPQGAFTLASGTASAPGLKFSDSSATGMFSPSTGVLGFSTGSTQNALTILANGNVGIGDTTPGAPLSIKADSTSHSLRLLGRTIDNLAALVFYSADETTYYSYLQSSPSYLAIATASTEALRIVSSGNVGIGFTNPTAKLVVASNGNGGSRTSISPTFYEGFRTITGGYTLGLHAGTVVDQETYLGNAYYVNNNYYDVLLSGGASLIKFMPDGSLRAFTNSGLTSGTQYIPTERFRLTSAGNVGIGTTNPTAKTHIRLSGDTAEPVLYLHRANNSGGGAGNPEIGLEVNIPNTFNSAGTVYGVKVFARHNLGAEHYGGYFEAGGNAYTSGIGVYAKTTHTDTNGPGYQPAILADAYSNIGTSNSGYAVGVLAQTNDYVNNINAILKSNYTGSSSQTALRIERNGSYVGYITTSQTTSSFLISSSSGLVGDSTNQVSLHTNSNARITVTSTGNVGIGTTNPSNLLTLGASGGPTMRLADTSSGIFSILSSSSNGSITFSADHGNTGSATNIIFSSDGNQERLRIDSVGNTSIGGFAPSPDDLGGKNLEIGFVGNLIKGYQTGNLIMTNNAYYQGGWKYANTGKSISYYQMNGNEQIWMNSPSGTAGNAVTFTERARLNSGGFTSDFILLSSDNNHQIRSYVDAQKYFDIDGQLGSISYNGTSIGMSSLPGYGVAANLYLGGRQPILPSGWTGTISCIGNANSSSLGTQVLLQTSTDGDTWTTRDQTANTWSVTLTWTQTSAANVPLYVRFRLVQNSGGNVGEGSCRVSDIRITNLYSGPFGFRLSNKLISQYNYQSTTLSSDLTNYQIGLICGSGAFATNNIGHGIAFYSPGVSSSSSGTVVAAINSIDEGSQDAQGLIFCTANSTTGSLSQKLRISNTGNVGIGTTNPIDKLHVQDGRILNFHNVSGTTIHGVVSGYSIGTVATGQTNNANVASNCTYVGFSNDTSTGRTSFRGRFNLTLFGNGTDAAMPVYFTKFGYSGVESGTGGEFHGWIRIATPGSTNPTSYNYSGYNNWANFALQARFDLVHWNAKPHLFAIEYYIPYGRAGIFDIDVSGTQSMFTIWMLPGSYTVEFDACDGLTAHWRNNNNVGGAVDMREASSIVTRSPLAYASRDTRYDSTIMWGSNLVV